MTFKVMRIRIVSIPNGIEFYEIDSIQDRYVLFRFNSQRDRILRKSYDIIQSHN